MVLSALTVISAQLIGCSNKPADPVPFAEASRLFPTRLEPKVCAGKSNGKRFSVSGYLAWASGMIETDDPLGGGGRVGFVELHPTASKSKEVVAFRVPIRRYFGEGLESPKLENASTETKRVGRRVEEESTGEVSDESIRLHLADGKVADNKTKVRVSLEVEGNDGKCNLKYVTAAQDG
ncbi:MAG: hypothetical protein U0235_20135 [Polyangiaceae bacterium]